MVSESSCSNVPPRRGVSAIAKLRFNVVMTEAASLGSLDTDDPRCSSYISGFP